MNIERPTSNIEWEKMKKQTYDLEDRPLEERMNIEHRTSNIECRMRKKMTKQAYHLEERPLKKPNILSEAWALPSGA